MPFASTEIVRKYKVASRNESGFIRTYDFSGMESRSDMNRGVLVGRSYGPYDETRAYLDTAHSPFNGCPGEIVAMTNVPDLDTRVEASRGDTSIFPLAGPGLRMKTYGLVLGERQDTSIVPVIDDDERETYAEGLGLVSGSYGGYPVPPTTTLLIGYVKGGDTVGVVSPDSSFWHVAALRSQASHRKGPESLGEVRGDLSAYDAQGRRMPAIGRRNLPSAVAPRFGN